MTIILVSADALTAHGGKAITTRVSWWVKACPCQAHPTSCPGTAPALLSEPISGPIRLIFQPPGKNLHESLKLFRWGAH
jgi:hypothetical protein